MIVTSSYIDVSDANSYFLTRLGSDSWFSATTERRNAALVTATRAIDRLNFILDKDEADQTLEFPRTDQTEVPQDILIACCEEAYVRIDGKEPEPEMSGLYVAEDQYANVRQTYDRSIAVDNVKAGILSHVAWTYLVRWLRDPNEIVLSRV